MINPMKSTIIREGISWTSGGIVGVGKFGILAASLLHSLGTTGKEYGMGAGIVLGIAHDIPYLMPFVELASKTKYALDWGIKKEQKRGRLEMYSNVSDNWGNVQTMRQESIRRLSRDRSSFSSRLGNEARFFAGR